MTKETPRRKPRRGVSVSAPKASSDADARAQLEVFIDKFDPKVAALARKALARMRKRLPGAFELIYDNYNALGVGFAGAETSSKTPLSIVLYPRWITLFFLKGASLSDPEGRLEGKGSTVRSIRIPDEKALTATLADPYIDGLITAAVLHAGWRLDPKAKGRAIIRAVVANQRPRRL